MGDSDEEEMKAMRSSQRYAGGRKPAETEKRTSAAETIRGPAAAKSRPGPPPAAGRTGGGRAAIADEDSDDGMVVDAEDQMKGMGIPMAFGRQKADRDVGKKEAFELGRRKESAPAAPGGVQFGPRIMGAAASQARKGIKRGQDVGPAKPVPEKDGNDEEASDVQAQAAAAAAAAAAQAEAAEMALIEAPPEPGKEHLVMPVSHEVIIPAHEKAVTALGLDPKGARMITGGLDGQIRFFDFNGMSEAKESFRTLEPVDGHMVSSISWAPAGGCALVVCSDAHCRIYDRDGTSTPIQMTVKGDMYVRDMTHTKGHTQMLTDGIWHPFAAEHWLTSALDGTMRIWDINAPKVGMDQVLPSIHVLKCLDKRNCCTGGGSGRTGGLYPTCCTITPVDAKRMVAGCSDGSVQLFNEKARYSKPDKILRSSAHTEPVTSCCFVGASQPHLLVTRSMDNTMKFWDCRMLSDEKGPLSRIEDIPAGHEKTGVCASPDGRYVVTGTSFRKGVKGSASVRVYDTQEFKLEKSMDFGARSVVRLCWHKEMNQILVGTGSGEVVMLYSPYSSKKGALHFVGKRAKVKDSSQMEDTVFGPIFNMTDHQDVMKFYSTGHGNMTRIRQTEARKEQKTKVPERPRKNDGSDSAATAGTTLVHKTIMKHEYPSGKNDFLDKDSQQALLAKHDVAAKNPIFVDHAYKKNQPVKILDYSVDEQSEGDRRMQEKLAGDFCKKCGQMVCRCVDYSVYGDGAKHRKLNKEFKPS
eukprot:gnl/TRDRNA2_/TRDRNA2_182373_c0_seq1.p1 gnl/TRDRNA2_/TRDRNA2_182373_c0~~gnl/TRDRNA2_/TRDRNA2_182373_c0_seq1.p1  ORF type:complete len:771 (+),score=172.36 gnl/TRDRNA2_/TRDRNA2_182373_c0_seq1:59-2314(+)